MIWQYEHPRFVAGTVGEPGDRAFYIQAAEGRRITSVLLEKQQVSLLAEKVVQILDGVRRDIPEAIEGTEVEPDNDPLVSPVEAEFRVGAIGLGFDTGRNELIIELHSADDGDREEVVDLGDDDEGAPDTLRVWIAPAYAQMFANRCSSLVAAGRPQCPFCALPIDPAGHICPRANGYRR